MQHLWYTVVEALYILLSVHLLFINQRSKRPSLGFKLLSCTFINQITEYQTFCNSCMLSSYFLTCASISFFHHRMDSNIPVYELKMLACFLDIIRLHRLNQALWKVIQEKKIYRNFFKKTDKLIRKKIHITNKTEFSHGLLHYVSVCVCFVESLKCHPLFKNMK